MTVSQLLRTDVDEDILSRIYDFDFRYDDARALDHFASWFHEQVDLTLHF